MPQIGITMSLGRGLAPEDGEHALEGAGLPPEDGGGALEDVRPTPENGKNALEDSHPAPQGVHIASEAGGPARNSSHTVPQDGPLPHQARALALKICTPIPPHPDGRRPMPRRSLKSIGFQKKHPSIETAPINIYIYMYTTQAV